MTREKANDYISNNKHKVNHQFRLLYHGMPEIGWMNDPNGLSYFKGNYHVFYQHNPYDTVWGPMHWGHMISKDLIKFEYLPVALAPDKPDESGCYSGAAIVKDDQLYLMYTKHFDNDGVILETQGIASSKDGIHFHKSEKPFIDSNMTSSYAPSSDVRDPSPYYLNGLYYVFIGSKTNENKGKFLIYQSKDLIDYTFHSELIDDSLFGIMGECPDLCFVDNKNIFLYSKISFDKENQKNINSSHYIIGDFDLEHKKYEFENIRLMDSGHHFYAPQSLIDDKGRTIVIAWMEMWGSKQVTHELGHNWIGALSFPRLLSFKNGILYQNPIPEIKNYYHEKTRLSNYLEISKHSDIFIDYTKEAFVIRFENIADPEDYYEIGYINNEVYVDGMNVKISRLSKKTSLHQLEAVSLRILLDTSSIEIFINDGIETFTSRIYITGDTYHMNNKNDLKGYIYSLKF